MDPKEYKGKKGIYHARISNGTKEVTIFLYLIEDLNTFIWIQTFKVNPESADIDSLVNEAINECENIDLNDPSLFYGKEFVPWDELNKEYEE